MRDYLLAGVYIDMYARLRRIAHHSAERPVTVSAMDFPVTFFCTLVIWNEQGFVHPAFILSIRPLSRSGFCIWVLEIDVA